MEYIVGETWDLAWKNMNVKDKEEAITQMRGYMDELRRLHEGV